MNNNTFQLKGFLVWTICAIFFMYEFMLRTITGTFQHQLMSDLDVSGVQFSFLSTTIFLIVYGVMQIPVGILVENFGLKKTLFVASFICGCAAIGFSYSNGFYSALVSRMFMGFGASFGFVCLLMAVNNWMPRAYLAIFIGLSQFIGTLGPMVAAGPLASLSMTVSWQSIFFVLGIAGIVISALVFFFVSNNDQSGGKYALLSKPEKTSERLRKLFSRSQPWIIAFTCMSLYFTIEYLSENEGRLFLGLKGYSLQAASNMLTIAWIGYAVGSPLVGLVSDWFKRRKGVLIGCSGIGLIAICMIIFLNKKILLQAGFFLLGIGASGLNVGFAMVSEQFKQQFVAVGFGLTNAVIMSISAINAPVIGFVLDLVSHGNKLVIENYMYVFSFLIFLAVLALILSVVFIKETFCKSAVDYTYLENVT